MGYYQQYPSNSNPLDAVRWICPKCKTTNGIEDPVCCVGGCGGLRPPQETVDRLVTERMSTATSRPFPSSDDAADAAKWRALRNCARITAMGSAGLTPEGEAYRTPYAHVTLNFWTGVKDEDAGPPYAREWLDAFVEKALRAQAAPAEELPRLEWVIVSGSRWYGRDGKLVDKEEDARGFPSSAEAAEYAKGMRCPWTVTERRRSSSGPKP